MNRARELGWSKEGRNNEFLSTDALANKLLIQFIDLAAKADRGELRASRPSVQHYKGTEWS